MSAGTDVVIGALSKISVYSPMQKTNSESLNKGKDVLMSMLASWNDDYGIDMGTVPIDDIGEELSEPLGARDDIESCLAIKLAPLFPGSQVSPLLASQAMKGFESIRRTWEVIDIPKRQVRGTLPRGEGNKNYRGNNFMTEGQDIG